MDPFHGIRDHPQMMSTLRRGGGGRWPKRENNTDRLHDWDSDKGVGAKKLQKSADVIYGWSRTLMSKI